MDAYEEEHGMRVRPEQIGEFSMKHDGECFRNSKLTPCVAEEHQCRMVGQDLIVDENGKYRGDDMAIFCQRVNADNDTKGPKNIIRVQNEIIGSSADNIAEHLPDKGHVLKCNNNKLFKIREQDKTLKGVHALTNLRIKSINSDISRIISDYEEKGVGNEEARKACLEQLGAIITHHCGLHHDCKHEKWCQFLRAKNANPEGSESELAAEAARASNRSHEGKNMSLSSAGIMALTKVIQDRFNELTIDKVAGGGCSNLSENFWSTLVKFTEGKRLNYDHTDAWEIMNMLCFCRKGEGNIRKTNGQVLEKVGVQIKSPQTKYQGLAEKKNAGVRKIQSSPKFKATRSRSKMTRAHLTGKIDAKKMHKSGKVPLSESAKSSIGPKAAKKTRGPKQCSNCKQFGHNVTDCPMPVAAKRSRADLVDFDIGFTKRYKEKGIKSRKRRKKLDLIINWYFSK